MNNKRKYLSVSSSTPSSDTPITPHLNPHSIYDISQLVTAGGIMDTTTIDVTCCRDCKFFWRTITKKMGAIPHCNFYPFLTWKLIIQKRRNIRIVRF